MFHPNFNILPKHISFAAKQNNYFSQKLLPKFNFLRKIWQAQRVGKYEIMYLNFFMIFPFIDTAEEGDEEESSSTTLLHILRHYRIFNNMSLSETFPEILFYYLQELIVLSYLSILHPPPPTSQHCFVRSPPTSCDALCSLFSQYLENHDGGGGWNEDREISL